MLTEGLTPPINPPILEIIFSVVFVDCPQNPAGITDGHDAGGKILGYHTARTDYYVVTDGHTGQENGSGSNPTIATDTDWCVILVGQAA